MYRRAREGELKGFTGVDGPYEPPVLPELTVHTARESVEESVERLEGALLKSGRLAADDPCLPESPTLERRFAELFVWR
jgi:adenylylsulfate kinase-like enzyme